MGIWQEALGQGKSELGEAYGYAQGVPRIPEGRAARALLMYRELARRAGVPFDWFLPSLAVLEYDKRGDKFPGQAELPARATKLVPVTNGGYFWLRAQTLADALDRAGVPVTLAQDLLPYWQSLDTSEWATALQHLALDAWEELQLEREHGEEPTWPDDLNTALQVQQAPAPAPAPDVEEDAPQAERIPPLPDKPPPAPIDPSKPPVTGPPVPELGGGGKLVLGLFLLYMFTK